MARFVRTATFLMDHQKWFVTRISSRPWAWKDNFTQLNDVRMIQQSTLKGAGVAPPQDRSESCNQINSRSLLRGLLSTSALESPNELPLATIRR
mmetsp:Transcript_43679/g.132888  ORF Transcript_43679/g.132888 Transcript_43679/m.132888 type:complete len:94 (+) Transcript_43679:464-745(+)